MLYLSLFKYHERNNQLDSALYYNKQYANLLQNDFKARVRDQLSSVQAYYELELNKNELKLSHEEVKSRNTTIIAISIGVGILVVLLIIVWRFYLLKQTANQALKNLNRKISIQSLKLKQANDEISRINENLEGIVNERTLEVQKKNEILIEYAHSNAHKVRGPLARILGVLSIINLTIHDSEMRELTDRIHESAKELDEVVREINQKLEE
jgi:signal transduction histidine kinase